MRVSLLLFAGLREAVGKKQLYLELDADTTLGELIERAERELPPIEAYKGRLVVSVNQDRVSLEHVLREGDEIAFLPPMSGGARQGDAGGDTRAWVQSSALSMDALLALVQGPGMGGVVTFTGAVRDYSKGHVIERLEYEAYEPMAEKEMRSIVAAAEERWPEARLAMSHRIGELAIGDAAVMIAAAAPHRPAAFEVCRFAIDTLKQTVPIWKKEFADDGNYWVEENP